MKHYHSAGCIVVKEANAKLQVLCIKYKYNKEKIGFVLPKGGIEEGETEEQAAIRETNEETGLQDIQILEKLGDMTFEFKNDPVIGSGSKTITWFLAKSETNTFEKLSLEESEKGKILEVKWLDINFAVENLLHADDAEYIRLAQETLEKSGNR